MNRRFFIGAMGAASVALGAGRIAPVSPKYVFLLIGDGMGGAQREVAERYARAKYPSRNPVLSMNRLPVRGMASTNDIAGKVTDSAASGTALACGEKTLNGTVGLGRDLKSPLRSMAYDAQEAGMKVGIVTSVPIDHATPACFYARVPKRNMYYEITEQLPQTGFDYFAGEPLLGRGRAKGKTAPDQLLEAGGYRLVKTRREFDALQAGDRKIVVEHKMGYAIDGGQEFPLADLTRKGIELLDGEPGFFMMVEGGKIDWSGHANDLATNIHETLAFDEAVAAVMEFYEKHRDETLVVVTADHETGGLELASRSPKMVEVVDAQESRGQKYVDEVGVWKKQGSVSAGTAFDRLVGDFGLSDLTSDSAEHIRKAVEQTFKSREKDARDPEIQKMYGKRNAAVTSCLHALAECAGARWTSYQHTAALVPTTAVGVGADQFAGEYSNADIGKCLKGLMQG
ncbi:alkaline phosphatase [Pontiella agarivorans]|uniref:Alkaline phosphatase n=1 Tax=Pontiella agarivorans TaxID=3038953 RepID=A0ABU5MU53_9BACT|nr:alkaline phosphatase [Pontiella agarivorans]MDZ8117726.1 alkaline phosphatase [Pontiella agarivorans]